MERSVDVHTPDSAVSRTWFRSGSISVQDIPLLVDLIISVFLDDLSVLVIKFALNTKYLLLFINNDTVVILEELVPSGISGVAISISTSDIHRSLSVVH
jgi:hypothetical protein